MVKDTKRVERPVEPKEVEIVILSDIFPQYDAKFRMLESSSDWPIREWIGRTVVNQYERHQSERSTAGDKVMLAGRGDGRKSNPPPMLSLLSTGRTAQGCKEYVIINGT